MRVRSVGELPKGLKVSEQGKWYSVPKDNAENGNATYREKGENTFLR